MTDERLMIEEEFEDGNKPKRHRKSFVFDEKNYFNDKLKKGEEKKESRVRILPINGSEENFKDFSNFKAFFVTYIHSLKLRKEIQGGGFKKFFCLNDPNFEGKHGSCPLCEKSKSLYALADACDVEAQKKSLSKSAGEYRARKSYIVRVIERGHEQDGVKFWRFNANSDGKGIFDMLKSLYDIRNKESLEATGEKYNIFDLKNGKDIIVTSTYNPDTDRTSITITDAGFSTPLSKDENQMMEWINDPKTWKDVYSIKRQDYLSIIADGGIPVWSEEKNGFVAKEEGDENGEGNNQKDKPKPKPEPEPEPEVFEQPQDDLPF